jgi:hypothetical protein
MTAGDELSLGTWAMYRPGQLTGMLPAARMPARFCDRRAALDNHGISSKSAAVMPRDLRGIGRPTVSAFCVNHSDRRLVPVAGPPSSPARP